MCVLQCRTIFGSGHYYALALGILHRGHPLYDVRIIRELLKHGADPEIDMFGQAPFITFEFGGLKSFFLLGNFAD